MHCGVLGTLPVDHEDGAQVVPLGPCSLSLSLSERGRINLSLAFLGIGVYVFLLACSDKLAHVG